MDKQPGTYPAFSDSPAFQPVLNWLSLGGKLLCVTSDDGYRPFRQFWDDIPNGHKRNGQVLLSTAGGATLFTGDNDGEAVKVTSFFEQVRGGLPHPRQATGIATKMLSDFFIDAFNDFSKLLFLFVNFSTSEAIFSLRVSELFKKISNCFLELNNSSTSSFNLLLLLVIDGGG